MNTKFYRCRHCGNIITHLHNSGVKVVCCGEPMVELIPNTVDASKEKHVPQIFWEGRRLTVMIGSDEHPMTEEHSIEWVAVETKKGLQIKYLKPGCKPEVSFILCEEDELVGVVAYCNLHGLWKA